MDESSNNSPILVLVLRKSTRCSMERKHHQCASRAVWLSSLLYIILVLSCVPNSSASQFKASSTHFTSSHGSGSNNATDGHALLSFKSLIFDDPMNALASWDDTEHFCQWRGVTCGDRRQQHRVTELDLESLDLAGSISPYIANLTFLQRLHLPENRLQGPIPEQLGLLSHLKHLNLSFNPLGGKIPPSLSYCSHLQNISLNVNELQGEVPANLSRCFDLHLLSLASNKLQGAIPGDLGSLPNLRLLSLESNKLTGGIPLSFGNLLSLTFLDLSFNNLTGGIPPSLGNLSTSLALLDLSDNIIAGEIPPSLGNLSSLVILDLSVNWLTGSITSLEKLSRLTELYLGGNSLTGEIPPSIGKNFGLAFLSVSYNNLTGDIPPSLGNLTSLTDLDLSHNSLGGEIPPSMGNLFGLTVLTLDFNHLSGTIPPSVWNLSSLVVLAMQFNLLTGALPWDLGQKLPLLRMLYMSSNLFHGPIPLPNASMLELIQLDENNFSGVIPKSLGNLINLSKLGLSGNQLEARAAVDWSFLTALTNCTNLKRLLIGNNDLRGMLPNSIANLSTRLEWLSINDNQISGSIPEEIGNLINLTFLSASNNLLTGTIPASLGRITRLGEIWLYGNILSGKIPPTLGNLTKLSQLYLNLNALSGGIPASIGICPLEVLNLAHNKLTGTIPKEVFTILTLSGSLDLSHNSFAGSLPLEVGDLKNLIKLAVGENKLSGEIPSSLGQCQILEYLHMDGNFFQGSIPSSLSQLRGLQDLDLSHNNLSGPIPKFLGSLPMLQRLNLSFNNFHGEVPQNEIFQNASGFSILGNKELCGGVPELNLPPCSNQDPGERIWPPNLTVTISVVCEILGCFLLLTSFATCYWTCKSSRVVSSETCTKNPSAGLSFAKLSRATNGFSSANLVGVGSFGSVYKGIMDYDGHHIIAVKVLNLQQRGASRSFITECETLRDIRHRNLVKILTSCSSVDFRGNDFKALVFQYLSNGSLDRWLHPQANEQSEPRMMLSLIQRLSIAIDVASALDYLHHHHGPAPIVHCDLKPSNILLNDDMVAHVSDFGLATILAKIAIKSSQRSTNSAAAKGTTGYVAPEYGTANKVSTQGDVYSYGILLLEMFTGKRPTDDAFKEGHTLHRFVERAIPKKVVDIIDPRLRVEWGEGESSSSNRSLDVIKERALECITSVLTIGILCSKASPTKRVQMGDVLWELQVIRDEFCEIEVQGVGRESLIET